MNILDIELSLEAGSYLIFSKKDSHFVGLIIVSDDSNLEQAFITTFLHPRGNTSTQRMTFRGECIQLHNSITSIPREIKTNKSKVFEKLINEDKIITRFFGPKSKVTPRLTFIIQGREQEDLYVEKL